jgi:hypothetical protein
MKLEEINFPIYVVGTEDTKTEDGVVFADNKVLDDTNMSGDTLGARRLQTSLPNLYPLRYMIKSLSGLVMHRGYMYIDSLGELFSYTKQNFFPLIYHKILNVEKKDIVSLLWLKDINFPIEVERPPEVEYMWAGIIYKNTLPWFFYEYSTEWKKDTRRKI